MDRNFGKTAKKMTEKNTGLKETARHPEERVSLKEIARHPEERVGLKEMARHPEERSDVRISLSRRAASGQKNKATLSIANDNHKNVITRLDRVISANSNDSAEILWSSHRMTNYFNKQVA